MVTFANSFGRPWGGHWTEEKLKILEDYLKAYTTALKKQDFHLTYVDAFAGTGAGSARRAIAVDDKPFDSFLFVERNTDSVEELRHMQQEFQNRDVRIEQADANAFLPMWCEHRNRKLGIPWRGHRAVVFLDPFATEVNWQTVAAIAVTQSIDLWVLFPLSALTRILPTARQPDESYALTLDRIYGGSEWRSLYRDKIVPTLFGDLTDTVRDDQQAIVEVYLDKLRPIFPAVADAPKWFYNSNNSPLFAFMFAAANPGRGGQIALSIAKHLLERW